MKNISISIDSSRFVGRIFDLSIGVYNFADFNRQDLAKTDPDILYVADIELRTQALYDRCHSIITAYEMLSVDHFPVDTGLGKISREEWIRLIIELLITRFSSIRDCTFFLVNEVLEIKLEPLKLKLNNLESEIKKNDSFR